MNVINKQFLALGYHFPSVPVFFATIGLNILSKDYLLLHHQIYRIRFKRVLKSYSTHSLYKFIHNHKWRKPKHKLILLIKTKKTLTRRPPQWHFLHIWVQAFRFCLLETLGIINNSYIYPMYYIYYKFSKVKQAWIT